MSAPLYAALLHYPVYKKNGEIITSSITPLDLHDIARSCLTFGVKRYYVVNHLAIMKHLAGRIAEFWKSEYGVNYNKTRTDALTIMSIKDHLEDCVEEIVQTHGKRPILVATSARRSERTTNFSELAERLAWEETPHLLLFGTGWGLIDEFIRRCDILLEPIEGAGEYNHLSVRSAAAIVLDRLCGNRKRD